MDAGDVYRRNNSLWWSGDDIFSRSSRDEDDEAALKWAALEKLPTYNRLRRGILTLAEGEHKEIDIHSLGLQEKKILLERLVRVAEKDNEEFLLKLRNRIDRVGIELPTIEVRYEHLNIQAEIHVGSRGLPTIWNSTINVLEALANKFHILPSRKRPLPILHDASGIIKPRRMTLLLGPPGSGKTTLLLALAGKLDSDLKVSGRVTFNGHGMDEFVPQRTAAYIGQHDLHIEMLTELSRREKAANIMPDPDIDVFMKAASMGGQESSVVADYMLKILGLEICADTMVGDEMRRGISGGQRKRVTTGEMLVGPARALFMDEISTGLDSSTTFQIVNSLRHSVHALSATAIISLLQPAPETYELFDDIILLSEGQIVYQGPREHVLEFFESMGFKCPERKGVADFLQEVTSRKDQQQYWERPDEHHRYVPVREFAEAFRSFHIGQVIGNELSIPLDKKSKSHSAVLTTSKYGVGKKELLKANLARELLLMKRNSFVYIFQATRIIIVALITMTTFLRTEMHHESVADGGIYMGALFYGLVTIMFNGFAELAMTIMKLPVFFRQRDLLFYPAWSYTIPTWILKIPITFMEVGIWVFTTYYVIGFDPNIGRQRDLLFYPAWSYTIPTWILKIPITFMEVGIWVFTTYYVIGFDPNIGRLFKQYLLLLAINQMASGLFRCIAALGRNLIVANTFGSFTMLILMLLGGFIMSREVCSDNITCFFFMYGISFAGPLVFWSRLPAIMMLPGSTEPLGVIILKSRGIFPEAKWYWIGFGALVGYTLLFNALCTVVLTYVKPFGKAQPAISEETLKEKHANLTGEVLEQSSRGRNSLNQSTSEKSPHEIRRSGNASRSTNEVVDPNQNKKGMVLPFVPLSMTFDNIRYYVDMPQEMKARGATEDRLELLKGVSGSFRPGVLTALMGVSGAGKTTLMDVLAGRKTGGYIEGNITISGYPKKQETFARISGYCEQNDIHSPQVTVYESLAFSTWLRLPAEVDSTTKKTFIEEVMELVELTPLRDALVGLPGVNGLSTEQRKRLTIAVELVANPSIIFMDEPTSGLDARAAAIVMRTVRNTVDTGRTVVCTIHQPSIDIFEAFDELLLLKQGGEEIYVGPLGRHSCHLINYFEGIEGVSKIKDGYNPAAWMLERTTLLQEEILGVNFGEIYKKSELHQRNKNLIKEMSTPPPGSSDLYFPTQYSQSFFTQCMANLWKQHSSYWRNPSYTAVQNELGAPIIFHITGPVVDVERTVFYRERAAGMYSALPYAFGQVAIEIPYILVQTLTYGVIVYVMIGLDTQPQHCRNSFLCVLCAMESILRIHNSSAQDSYLVEMVLLGMPCCMDLVWFGRFSVWRCTGSA
ncbi:ABC transporter G family member 37 [Cocos nucifera]|uniref:ABC transporter G family member 37 n=1 Tax=Cocos nucifera TaxID=13894 RepID=A0A8K0N260_COCNU|nr:ABC transporter G family member 37 [Cocos nucifera]